MHHIVYRYYTYGTFLRKDAVPEYCISLGRLLRNEPYRLNESLSIRRLLQVLVLHCTKQGEEGGVSELCDGLMVAEQMRREKPHAFELLSTVPIECITYAERLFKFRLAAFHRVIEYVRKGLSIKAVL